MNSDKTNKKRIIAPLVTAIIIIAVFAVSAVYYYHHTIIRDPVPIDPVDSEVTCQIDRVDSDGQYLTITGWAFREDTDTVSADTLPALKILLSDQSEERNLLTYRADYGISRPEVNEYFYNGYDYTKCGFQVTIPLSDMETGTRYEVLVQQNERLPDAVRTGVFITDGVQDQAEAVWMVPDIEGTDLEELVQEGHLCVARPDIGIYIFQKDWKIFWIADDSYDMNMANGYLQYQLYTTQADRLPEERAQARLTYDNLAFAFVNSEITFWMNAGHYRVAVMDIPTDYSVTCIETGCFSQEQWIWRERFLPLYPF